MVIAREEDVAPTVAAALRHDGPVLVDVHASLLAILPQGTTT
jgi:hypothetical protein